MCSPNKHLADSEVIKPETLLGLYRGYIGIIRVYIGVIKGLLGYILGLCRDNRTEAGNYYSMLGSCRVIVPLK